MNCSAITLKGIKCKNKAKINGLCGRHYTPPITVILNQPSISEHLEQTSSAVTSVINQLSLEKSSSSVPSSYEEMRRLRLLKLDPNGTDAGRTPVDRPILQYDKDYENTLQPFVFQTVSYMPNIYSQDKVSYVNMHYINNQLRELARPDALNVHWNSSIFFAVNEDKPYLFKFMIIGPADTPYENGVFIFDASMVECPLKPPKVTLLTTGGGKFRFNPNLYANGKVCLSLLGTWHEGGPETKWNQKYSTILQVMISIQALIFVKDPYYNEPGYENKRGVKQESDMYNRQIRNGTVEYAMIHCLKYIDNSEPFQNIIKTHFKLKRHFITDKTVSNMINLL